MLNDTRAVRGLAYCENPDPIFRITRWVHNRDCDGCSSCHSDRPRAPVKPERRRCSRLRGSRDGIRIS